MASWLFVVSSLRATATQARSLLQTTAVSAPEAATTTSRPFLPHYPHNLSCRGTIQYILWVPGCLGSFCWLRKSNGPQRLGSHTRRRQHSGAPPRALVVLTTVGSWIGLNRQPPSLSYQLLSTRLPPSGRKAQRLELELRPQTWLLLLLDPSQCPRRQALATAITTVVNPTVPR